MKRSVEWHEQCAANARKSIDSDVKKLESMQASIKRNEAQYSFRMEQIAEARRRGLTEFDADRLLVKRNI